MFALTEFNLGNDSDSGNWLRQNNLTQTF